MKLSAGNAALAQADLHVGTASEYMTATGGDDRTT